MNVCVHSSFSSKSTLSIAIAVPLNGLIYKSFQRESIVCKVQTPYSALLSLFYTLHPLHLLFPHPKLINYSRVDGPCVISDVPGFCHSIYLQLITFLNLLLEQTFFIYPPTHLLLSIFLIFPLPFLLCLPKSYHPQAFIRVSPISPSDPGHIHPLSP